MRETERNLFGKEDGTVFPYALQFIIYRVIEGPFKGQWQYGLKESF